MSTSYSHHLNQQINQQTNQPAPFVKTLSLDIYGSLLLCVSMQQRFFIFLGALGFFLGFPNPIMHIPLLVMAYPYALCMLGEHATSTSQALRTGWFAGTIGATVIMSWVIIPMNEVAGISLVLAAPCAVLLGLAIGIFGGAFSALTYLSRKEPLYLRLLFLGLSWYLLEYLRGFIFTGLPWASLSAAFVPWPPLIQGASIIGAYALSGLFAALAVIPALANNARRAWLSTAVLLIGLAFVGYMHLPKTIQGTPFTITMIQGNIDQNIKWNPRLQRQTLEQYIQLTNASWEENKATGYTPNLIIWPETAMPFDVQRQNSLTAQIQQLVIRQNTAVLFGAPGFVPLAPLRYKAFNRAYLMTPTDQNTTTFYEKEHLVPFGEYMPSLLDIPFLRPLLLGVGNFSKGTKTKPLTLVVNPHQTEKLGVLICYEAIFPELARKQVAEGASFFVNISNDAWFGKTPAAEQHLQLSAMRAVEQYRPIARATNTGITAFIDPYGRITARTALFETTQMTGFVIPQSRRTIFYALEPYLALVSLGGCMALCLGMLSRRKRKAKNLCRINENIEPDHEITSR